MSRPVPVTIRRATVDDLAILLEWGRALNETERHFEPLLGFPKEEIRSRYAEAIHDPSCLFLIAEAEGVPHGYLYAHLERVAYLETTRRRCELEVVYVDVRFRRAGLAQELVRRCTKWAAEVGALELCAGIYAGNTASRALFERSGFTMTHTTYTLRLE